MDSTTHTSASELAWKLAKQVWGRGEKSSSTLAGKSRKFSKKNNGSDREKTGKDIWLAYNRAVKKVMDDAVFRALTTDGVVHEKSNQ